MGKRKMKVNVGMTLKQWTGPGATDAARWAETLAPPLRALFGWRDRYTLQATLAPLGLTVHFPLVAATPGEEPFLLQQAAALAQGLGHLAATAEVEGVRLGKVQATGGECACCWEPVAVDATACPMCAAPHHGACYAWMGGCARFGCRATVTPTSAA